MKDINNAKRAIELKNELDNLKHFINTVCDLPDESEYFEKHSIFNLKIKHKMEISVFGNRPFNPGNFCGSHSETIKVPYSLIPLLKEKASTRIDEIHNEIKRL